MGTFERLEPRLTLSASSIDGRPFVDLGPSDNVALDQPRVTVELINSSLQSLGPSIFATWLLDTGANSTLTFRNAVNEMNQFAPFYQIEGQFSEIGVGGFQLFDISAPYRFDFAGYDGIRQTLLDTRILSDSTRDLSLFGPWGIKGMSAMTERYTTLDFTGWIDFDLADLFMRTSFPSSIPSHNGPRYTLSVDNRVSFSPDNYIVSGNHPPIWADLPFFEAELLNNGNLSSGNFLFDTGAQVSIISSQMAIELGLDSNLDGVLDERDAQFARMETVGGVGGMITVPVFLIDEVHIPTDQGPDLVLTDLQWLVLDIIDEIDGVFGFDNVTSGWIEGFFEDGKAGYIMKSHFDFQGWNTTGEGKIHFDLNPEFHAVVNPNGPGAIVHQPGGSTLVSESGYTDTYTIRLNEQPAASVFVSLVTPPDKVIAHREGFPSQTVLQFTPANWDVPQTVLVTAVNDNIQQSFHRGYVRHISSSSDPAYDGVGMPRVIVNIVDNDFPAVMIVRSNGETLVSEDAMTDTYQLVLTYPTSQDVTIYLEHLAEQVTAVSAANGTDSLVFTAANWNVPQTVLVSAIDDDLVEGLHRAWITHRIDTGDPGYQQAFALQEAVFIIDNDTVAPPPTITDVIVSSSQWNAAMIDTVDGGGVGSGNGIGFSLVGGHQLDSLPWNHIDQIHVVFSDDVSASFTASNVALVGTNNPNYMPQASLFYGAYGLNVGTIALSQPLVGDALILAISEFMQSASGVQLDGDWIDAASLQSGNGTAGGQFNFRINVLKGDVDNSKTVTFGDISAARSLVGTQTSNPQNARYDIDGSGTIAFSDLSLIRARVGTILPAPPSPPAFGGDGEKGGAFGSGKSGSGKSGSGDGGGINFYQAPSRIEYALRKHGLTGMDVSMLPIMQWTAETVRPAPFTNFSLSEGLLAAPLELSYLRSDIRHNIPSSAPKNLVDRALQSLIVEEPLFNRPGLKASAFQPAITDQAAAGYAASTSEKAERLMSDWKNAFELALEELIALDTFDSFAG